MQFCKMAFIQERHSEVNYLFEKIQFHEEKKILLLSYFFLLFVGPLASSFRGFKPPLGLSRYQDTIQGKFLRHI